MPAPVIARLKARIKKAEDAGHPEKAKMLRKQLREERAARETVARHKMKTVKKPAPAKGPVARQHSAGKTGFEAMKTRGSDIDKDVEAATADKKKKK